MSIFLTKDSRVIVQGITGGEGSKHTALMLKAGTQVVGGVNARKAGTTVEHGDVTLPVFGTVSEAMSETRADVSVVFVPPAFAKDAVMEAIDAAMPLIVVITEGRRSLPDFSARHNHPTRARDDNGDCRCT
jgi:succinyl-CoA synthetase alpha subunit